MSEGPKSNTAAAETVRPVEAPRAVAEGILTVRQQSVTNMYNRDDVRALAERNGDTEAVEWIEDNPESYFSAVTYGLSPPDSDAVCVINSTNDGQVGWVE